MKVKHTIRRSIYCWMGAILCMLLLVNTSVAENENPGTENNQTKRTHVKIKKNFINPTPVSITARVMIVNKDNFYIVIAEKYFYVAKFKVNGETYQTGLTDTAGNKLQMDDFNRGDRVKVTAIGLETKKGLYVAQQIQKLPPRKKKY